MRLSTLLIHAGELSPRPLGAVAMPVFQTSTFEYTGDGAGYHDLRYLRLNNTPNHLVLGDKLAALEGTESALVTGSGMAAIAVALLSQLKSGDHVLAHDCLYGGTLSLLSQDLADLGIQTSYVDASRPDAWRAALRPTTKLVYVEAITNPTMRVVDLEATARFAKEHSLVSVIDATMASPVNLRPASLGFDLVVHSATKYLNGHSDIVAGVVAGRSALVAAAKKKLDHFGAPLDPHACFLLHRGLKTLAVRVRHQNETALRLAGFLESHAGVRAVSYPGLASHPDHARARAVLDGYGGMLAFRPKGGVSAAEAFLSRVKLAIAAPSLGGPETLVTRPTRTSHVAMPPEERERIGVFDDLIRVSIGLEDAEDLEADFGAALA